MAAQFFCARTSCATRIFLAQRQARWPRPLGEDRRKELTSDGNFYRTLWHEVGHYLGVDQTKDGRDLDQALQDDADALEEMKADLVSLFVAEALHKQGYYTDAQLRSVYAGGILRVLQNNKPRRDQPYNTMQLMQWNFFLENGLLTFENGKLRFTTTNITTWSASCFEDRARQVQYDGDKAAADRFIDQYTTWRRGSAWRDCEEHSRQAALSIPIVQVCGAGRVRLLCSGGAECL